MANTTPARSAYSGVCRWIALALVGLMLAPTLAAAQTTITTSVTYDGTLYSQPLGTLTIDGVDAPILTLINGAGTEGIENLTVGATNSGGVVIENGSFLSSGPNVMIGAYEGSNGTVTVSGSGWGNAYLYIGGNNLTAGGEGHVTITDGGWLGAQLLQIWSGGSLHVATGNQIGVNELWVRGGDLTIESAFGIQNGMPSSGAQSLTIDGGTVTVESLFGSNNAFDSGFNFNDGTLIIDGGTYLQSFGPLVLDGNTATAIPTLVLTNGATIGVTDLVVGNANRGAFHTHSSLTLGGSGKVNTLSVSTGSTATIDGLLVIQSGGTLTLNGGTVAAQSFQRAGGTFDFIDGTLVVDGGSFAPDVGSTLVINGSTSTAMPTLVLANGATTPGISSILVGTSNHGAFHTHSSMTLGGSGNLASLSISSGSSTTIDGALTIQSGGTLTINGGAVSTQSFSRAGGGFFFNDGTLTIHEGTFTPNTGSIFVINGNTTTALPTLVLADNATFSGFGYLRVGNTNQGAFHTHSSLTLGGFGNLATLSVSPGSTATIDGSLSFQGGTLTLSGGAISAQSFNRTGGTFNFIAGTLTVNGGTYSQSSGTLTISGNTASIGSAIVLASGATASGVTGLTVGSTTSGSLSLLSGSTLSVSQVSIGKSAGSTGSVTVSGSGSNLTSSDWVLFVGESGTGHLSVLDGGKVTSQTGIIAKNASSSGTVTVSGSNALWSMSESLAVAYLGTGTLNILAGGKVTNHGGEIGLFNGAQGAVTVSGSGSTWINNNGPDPNGNLTVGGSMASATLQILDAGVVQSDFAIVAGYLGSNGSVTVSGAGSTWTNDYSLEVGSLNGSGGAGSLGQLTVANGGTLNVGSMLKLWTGSTITLDGGTINAHHFDFSLGTFNFNGGVLNVSGTMTTPVDYELHVDNGSLVNNGVIAAAVTVGTGGTVGGGGVFDTLHLDGGIIAPGNSPGTITSNETIINSGIYQWQINQLAFGTGLNPLDNSGLAGMDPGWDLWDAGVLTIGGPLTIELHSLAAGDVEGALLNWDPTQSYTWLIASSTNGAFATISGLTIDDSFFDSNEDGFNDLAGGSFDLWGDGNNLYLDFTAAAVPEPSTLLLASIAAGGLAAYRRKRSRCQPSAPPGD